MAFQIAWENHLLDSQAVQSCLLTEGEQGAAAEIWPELGANCLRWRVASQQGPVELLYVHPEWPSAPARQRSGIPVLFPFPNRIRNGRFTWDGKDYVLELNDPHRRHSIHGFACRSAWRVVDCCAQATRARLTVEFRLAVDAPHLALCWPGDVRVTLQYVLTHQALMMVATMDNPGTKAVPVGLGYHPYFRVPWISHGSLDECRVQVAASHCWTLSDRIPVGTHSPLDPQRDLQQAQPVSQLQLDDVYTGFAPLRGGQTMRCLSRLSQDRVGRLEIWASAGFRELVVFTPDHRQAICLEPYTCVTDAIHLQQQGVDAGLRILQPGESVTESIVYLFVPHGDDAVALSGAEHSEKVRSLLAG